MLVANNVDTVKNVGELEEPKSEEEAEREAVAAAEREAAATAATRPVATPGSSVPTRPQRGLVGALPGAR